MRRLILLSAIAGLLSIIPTASAGVLTSTVVAGALDYNPPPYNSYSEHDLGSSTRHDNGALSFNSSYSFNGVNGSGAASTMTYSVAGSAQSDYGVLRASFNTSLTNAFYNQANAAYNPATLTGVPNGFNGQSNAEFADTLNVTGGAGIASIRLVVGMSGTLSQSGSAYPFAAGYAALWQTYPQGYYSIIPGARSDTSPGGNYEQQIVTDPFVVTNGQANVDLLLQAYTSWQIFGYYGQYLADGSSVSSSINFSNTVRVVGVEAFDVSGNQVQLTSVIGTSGTTYYGPATAAPEPGSVVLFAVGLVGFLAPRLVRKRLRPLAA
jgi:hypothetical protein